MLGGEGGSRAPSAEHKVTLGGGAGASVHHPSTLWAWAVLSHKVYPPCPTHSMVSDGTVAIFISIIMFIVPSKIPGLTQDPGKHLDRARKGLWSAPAFSHVMHLWQGSTKPREVGVTCQRHGLRNKVGTL